MATTPETLAATIATLGVRRMLVVSDGDYDRIRLALRLEAPEVNVVPFATDRGPAVEGEVRSALDEFRSHGCDSILAIGGDGAIDTAKLVKAFASEADDRELSSPPATATTPLFAVPVGAGLGSEATNASLVRTATGVVAVSGDALAVDRTGLLPSASKELSEADRTAFGVTVMCHAIDLALAEEATDAAVTEAGSALSLVARSLFDFLAGDDPRAHNNMALAAHRIGAATSDVGIISAMALALVEQTALPLDAAFAACVIPALRALDAGRPVPRTRPARGLRAIAAACGAKDASSAVERVARLLAFLQVRSGAPRKPTSPEALVASCAARVTGSVDPAELGALFRSALSPSESAPPADASLAHEFAVLRRFTDFAWRYQLTCFLFGETLRDAIVHGRLTPWNPGITLAMPRDAYAKLTSLRDRLPRGLVLDDFTSNPDRASVLPRIVDESGSAPPHDAAGFAALPGITIHVLEGRSRTLTRRVPQYALQRLLYAAYGAARAGRIAPARARALASAAAKVSDATRAARRPYAYVDLVAAGGFAKARFPAVQFREGRLARLGDVEFTVPDRATAVLRRLFGAGYSNVASVRVDAPVRTVPASADGAAAAGRPAPLREPPFISIVVPVYNVQRYLAACLDSLCNQGYEHYEIIAVDDGSTDESGAILAEYARRHPDLIRVLRKENGGLADARNHGIAHAKGEYLLFVDSDDLISRQSLRILADRVCSTDADMIAFGFYDYWSDADEPTARFLGSPENYGHAVRESPQLLLSVRPYAWNKLYRASLFSDFGISYPKGQAFEDSATTYNLMLEANRVELVPDALYYYRRDNPDSITNTVSESFYDILKSFRSIRDYYRSHGAFEQLRPELLELTRRIAASRFHRLESARDPEFVARFVDAVYDDLDANEPGWNTNEYFEQLLASPSYREDPRHEALMDRASMKRHLVELNEREVGAADAPEHSTAELGRMLQQEGLRILVEIDEFCRRNDITYYLAEGTLLGAVRHQGFVPWDDDIDITMPRVDYERFVSLLQSGAAPQLRLFNSRTFPRYHLTFTKVLAVEPSEFTTMFVDVPEQFRGPAVDVFPLDAGVKARFPRRERRVRWLRDVLLFKGGYLTVEKRPHQKGRALASRVLSFRYLQRAIDRYYRIHETSTTPAYLVNFASSYTVDKEKFRTEWLGRPQRVPFENHLLPIPADADAVLMTTYGNYMKLPPKAKRAFRHRPTWRGERMHTSA